ncbi:hypothetical protein HMPREF9370_1124 [Neisseria wadsworthii 9715]|uniref:Uncharacterized protein n=1 Tax=Neisseria wadsworthii 9715 TaxID=1030841 RepID=G4CPW4_9NEIS|nr:hypothetical protein HMPREF9370_1124 [Neisseria wadsworthii 9715]
MLFQTGTQHNNAKSWQINAKLGKLYFTKISNLTDNKKITPQI